MEKIITSFYLIGLALIFLVDYVTRRFSYGLTFGGVVYWYLLIGLVFLVFKYKLKSKTILGGAFLLYACSSILVTLMGQEIGENIMRVSFVAWIVGLFLALLEYKRNAK